MNTFISQFRQHFFSNFFLPKSANVHFKNRRAVPIAFILIKWWWNWQMQKQVHKLKMRKNIDIFTSFIAHGRTFISVRLRKFVSWSRPSSLSTSSPRWSPSSPSSSTTAGRRKSFSAEFRVTSSGMPSIWPQWRSTCHCSSASWCTSYSIAHSSNGIDQFSRTIIVTGRCCIKMMEICKKIQRMT